MKAIYEKLSQLQRELKAPKNLYNSYGNYNYRNAEGILEAVKPMLGGYVILLNDEPVIIGSRYYIKAVAMLTDGEESISTVAYAREDEAKKGMDGCQITGSCSSYARKYALNALLMIDDSKDSDDDALSPKNPKNTEEPKKKESKPVRVETVAKVPPANPVKEYVLNEMAFMQQLLGIEDKEQMKKKFANMRTALIAGGVIPDIKSDAQTMEDAKNMIEAMYANFMSDKKDSK